MSEIKVSRLLVESACKNAIDIVKAKRKELFDIEVDKVMKRWFFPIKKRSKAEDWVKVNGDGSLFHLPTWKIWGWGIIGKAETLLKAVSISADEYVVLDADDASFVAEWHEERYVRTVK